MGLNGYYRRFIRDYAAISHPLTALLKKNAFVWGDSADFAFEELKKAMTHAPVLKMPNFDEPFIIETDASGCGIGAVLQQGGHPIAFMSKILAPKHHTLSTYEKEFLAVIQALKKWRGYLLDKHFIIRTNHFSLKHLLEQRITTPAQMKWLPKLMDYDYEIVYKKGKENVSADALSRLPNTGEMLQMLSTTLSSDFYQRIVDSWTKDVKLQALIQTLQTTDSTSKHYTWSFHSLLRKGKLVVGDDAALKQELLHHFHDTSQGGHSGIQATTKRLCAQLYWKKMRKDVKIFVRNCVVCQRFKPELVQPPSKSVILVIVDRLSKYSHFIPLSHPYTALFVAQAFLDNIYKLHGLPKIIVSDRDAVFLSKFWKELFGMLQVNLHMSTAYHPQSDGQTEIVNKAVECYLRCMSGDKPKDWAHWISLAEYWYNTTFHTAINTTPYQVVYGQPPPTHIAYTHGESRVEAVDRSLSAREKAIQLLKFHLKRAQSRMKAMADRHKTDREFQVGALVYLKLQPYRQSTLRKAKHHKLSPKYFGPFKVIQKVGKVAYKLELPESAQIHPVFHVSQLKLHRGDPPTTPAVLPVFNKDGVISVEPYAILERRMAKRGNAVAVYVLVQWLNGTVVDATWELYEDIAARFPSFDIDA